MIFVVCEALVTDRSCTDWNGSIMVVENFENDVLYSRIALVIGYILDVRLLWCESKLLFGCLPGLYSLSCCTALLWLAKDTQHAKINSLPLSLILQHLYKCSPSKKKLLSRDAHTQIFTVAHTGTLLQNSHHPPTSIFNRRKVCDSNTTGPDTLLGQFLNAHYAHINHF